MLNKDELKKGVKFNEHRNFSIGIEIAPSVTDLSTRANETDYKEQVEFINNFT